MKPESQAAVSLVAGAGSEQVTAVVDAALSGLHDEPLHAVIQKLNVPLVNPEAPAPPVYEVLVPRSSVPETPGPDIRR